MDTLLNHHGEKENIDYDAEYSTLPPLPKDLPLSFRETFKDESIPSEALTDWLIPEAFRITATQPGWLQQAEWLEERQRDKVKRALESINNKYAQGKYTLQNRDLDNGELNTIIDIGGVYMLPAILLRAVEVLAPDNPVVANFWRGGSYQEGQSLHGLNMKEFSLNSATGKEFVTLAPRTRPAVFQFPVPSVVAGFREGRLTAVQETSNARGLFGYSALISTLNHREPSGLIAYRVEPPSSST
jgi:hypothetical protein